MSASTVRLNTYKDYEAVCDFARAALKAHDRDDPLDALASIHNVTYRAELATAQTVDAARAEGATWSTIGMALGMTKQAAQQRYGHKDYWTAADTTAGLTPSMLSKP